MPKEGEHSNVFWIFDIFPHFDAICVQIVDTYQLLDTCI